MSGFRWFFLFYILLVIVLFIADFIFVLPRNYIFLPLFLAFYPILFEALQQLRKKVIGTEFFLTIAAVIGLFGGEERAVTTVLIIMLIAEFLDQLVQESTNKELKSLVSLLPETVDIVIDSKGRPSNTVRVLVSEVNVGMKVMVKEGERIPVDGTIESGMAQINESALTGESLPKEKTINNQVFAGTFIENGSLIIKATKVGKDTFFGKIKALIEHSEKTKAEIASYASKIATILVPSILGFIFLVWLITGNFRLVVTLLVFGSPLELTLITPLTILAATYAAFKHGILIKGSKYLEQLANIDTLVFDKTGTLTGGEPEIVEVQSFGPDCSPNYIIQMAAIAEKLSSHLLAKAVLKKAEQLAGKTNLQIPDPDYFKSVVGHGIEIVYDNKHFFLGTKHFLEHADHANIKFQDLSCKSVLEGRPVEPHTTFYLGYRDESGAKMCGRICASDKIRQEAKSTINDFKKKGVKSAYIISGDSQKIADAIGASLNIDYAYGNMLPDQKIDMIKKLQEEGKIVTMIGDGINDAPAIKQANVGIAMGAMGMEPAIESADIVLMTNDLTNLTFVYDLAKKTLSIIKQNIFFGFAFVHLIGMLLAFFNMISPIEAAIFHAFEDLAIMFNSIRLINFKKRK